MDSRAEFVRWLFDEVWSQGRTEALGDEIGAVTFHYGGTTRETDGHDLKALVTSYRTGFPDLTLDVEDVVENADRVAVRLRMRGTHLGTWRDRPATGHSIDLDVAFFLRFDCDRLVEVWEVDDAARRDRQLGAQQGRASV